MPGGGKGERWAPEKNKLNPSVIVFFHMLMLHELMYPFYNIRF